MDKLSNFYLAKYMLRKMIICGSHCPFFVFNFQVSHHPPISACHCESKNFVFWQGLYFNYNFKIQLISL